MAIVTRVLPIRGGAAAIVPADSDWRVTAIAVRGDGINVFISDTVSEPCLLLRSPEYQLSVNILVARGMQLIFENLNSDQFAWQYAFFCAEEV